MKNNKEQIPKPPKTVVAPIGCQPWLTEGKEYNVIRTGSYSNTEGYDFDIISDTGETDFCVEKGCGHINFENWIIKEREQ